MGIGWILAASVLLTAQDPSALTQSAGAQRQRHSPAAYREAARLYRKAIAAAPKSAAGHAGLALVLLLQARTTWNTQADYSALVKEGAAQARHAWALNPGLPQARQAAALAAITLPDRAWTQRILARVEAQRAQPELAALLRGMLARDPAERQRWLQEAVDRSPKDYMALVILGGFYRQRGLLTEAEGIYRRMAEAYPESAFAQGELGSALLAHHQTRAAEAPLRASMHLDPHNPVAAKNLGDVLLATGRPAEAVKVLEPAVHRAPGYINARLSLAVALAQVGRMKDAERHLKEATRREPASFFAWNNLGSLYAMMGRAREAEVAIRKALSLNPRYAEAHLDLGWALYLQGRYEEAREATEKTLLLSPDLALARYNLGLILLASGQPEEGIDAYETAVRRDGGAHAPGAIAELRALQKHQPENREIDLALGILLEPNDPNAARICYARYIQGAKDGPLRQHATGRLGALMKPAEPGRVP